VKDYTDGYIAGLEAAIDTIEVAGDDYKAAMKMIENIKNKAKEKK
jgi:hypothetical protein